VRDAWLGAGGLAAAARPDAVRLDCSTIDVDTAREVAQGRPMLDAPVSGGTMGAENATLTFMVGGAAPDFARAKPVLERWAARSSIAARAAPARPPSSATTCCSPSA
jgi:3-hydroxyisobutyrate dehydrogenase